MAGYTVTDKSNALSHRKSELAVSDARSGEDLSKLDWNKFAVSYLPDNKGLTQQQKRDVEAVAKSQVLNDLNYRRQFTTVTSGVVFNDGAFEQTLIKARDEAGEARARLEKEGIDADELLKQKK